MRVWVRNPKLLPAAFFLIYIAAFLHLRPDRDPQTWEPGEIASHLLDGEGYSLHRLSGFPQPSANQEPVYPLLIAALLTTMPAPYLVLTLLQVTVWILCSLLLARIANRSVGASVNWTAAVAALWPPIMLYVLSYHPLVLRASALIVVLATALRFRDKPSNGNAFLLGFVLGLAALVRSVFLLLPLIIATWVFLGKGPEHRAMARRLAISLVIGAVVLSPWLIRNRITLGAWIPGTTTAGYTALMGNFRGASGSLDDQALRHVTGELPTEFWKQPEPARDTAFKERVLSFWIDHPGAAGWLYLKKLLYLWTWRPGVGGLYSGWYKATYLALWSITLPAILVGWFLARKDPAAEAPHLFMLTWVVFSLVYAFFAVNMRYRFEAEPLLLPYAVVAWQHLASAFQRLRSAEDSGLSR